jgi:SET domain-containing protein
MSSTRRADDDSQTADRGAAVEIRRSQRHGWGVFARRDIASGEEIEVAPYLQIPVAEWERSTVLGTYVFDFDEGHVALGLGAVSLFNHDADPDAEVWFDLDREVVAVSALRPILAGAEIYISYRDDGDATAWGIDP